MTKPRSWFIQTEYMVDTETIYSNLKYNWLYRLKNNAQPKSWELCFIQQAS